MIWLYCYGSIAASDSNRLNKFIKRAGSVISSRLDNFEIVAERGTLNKLLTIMDNLDHPSPPPSGQTMKHLLQKTVTALLS